MCVTCLIGTICQIEATCTDVFTPSLGQVHWKENKKATYECASAALKLTLLTLPTDLNV
jgi:hypothetical protein